MTDGEIILGPQGPTWAADPGQEAWRRIDTVVAVARNGHRIRLDDDAVASMKASRAVIDHVEASPRPHYGVNTGFGSLSRHRIDGTDLLNLQRNLIRSHAAGVGEPLDDDVVRAMMFILAASLARGRSGVRVSLVQALLDLLNHDITPVVPSRGSVGASGDLAPLSHVALVLIGEGEARIDGVTMPGAKALRRANLEPVTLQAKEGLALINGTHMMAALAALALADTRHLQGAALAATALAIDANRATDAFLDDRVHAARGQVGQREVARRLLDLLRDSAIIPSHREDDTRVQDPYCLRAAPQVIGAAFDTVASVTDVIARELSAVTDNPLVFAERFDPGNATPQVDIISAGNFHGMPLAIAMDTLVIALAPIAGIAERRIYWLLKASDSENPVNTYLSPDPGLHSGLMIVQYAAAACCNEIQTLAVPASVANIPTSAGIEDYNSMGATSGHQLRRAVALATDVMAMELLTMTEAMEYQRPLRSGAGVERAVDLVRSVVPRLTEDRPPSPDIASIATLIRDGAFMFALE